MAAYRNETQHGEAIQLMLEASGLEPYQGLEPLFVNGFWTEAFDQLLSRQSKFSHGEQVMLQAALCLWNWNKEFALIELTNLEPRLAFLVLGLFMAWMQGPEAVDGWMAFTREGSHE